MAFPIFDRQNSAGSTRPTALEIYTSAARQRRNVIIRAPNLGGKKDTFAYYYHTENKKLITSHINISATAALPLAKIETCKNKKTYTRLHNNRFCFKEFEEDFITHEFFLTTPMDDEIPDHAYWKGPAAAPAITTTTPTPQPTTTRPHFNPLLRTPPQPINTDNYLPSPSPTAHQPRIPRTPTPLPLPPLIDLPELDQEEADRLRTAAETVESGSSTHNNSATSNTEPIEILASLISQVARTEINISAINGSSPLKMPDISSDRLASLLQEQPRDTRPLKPTADPPMDILLVPKVSALGRALAHLQDLRSAKMRHINQLADRRWPITPAVKPLQSPSLIHKERGAALTNTLNNILSGAAAACSRALIHHEEESETAQLNIVHNLWTSGAPWSNDELSAVQRIRDTRAKPLPKPRANNLPPFTFFVFSEGPNGNSLQPDPSATSANTTGARRPGNTTNAQPNQSPAPARPKKKRTGNKNNRPSAQNSPPPGDPATSASTTTTETAAAPANQAAVVTTNTSRKNNSSSSRPQGNGRGPQQPQVAAQAQTNRQPATAAQKSQAARDRAIKARLFKRHNGQPGGLRLNGWTPSRQWKGPDTHHTGGGRIGAKGPPSRTGPPPPQRAAYVAPAPAASTAPAPATDLNINYATLQNLLMNLLTAQQVPAVQTRTSRWDVPAQPTSTYAAVAAGNKPHGSGRRN